jgi:hypothetical protein
MPFLGGQDPVPGYAMSPSTAAFRYTTICLSPGHPLNPIAYKGFTITPRTFQIRGSGRWTLDLLISRHRRSRAFSGPDTYPTESAAVTGCCEFARRIIDGRVRHRSVDDLSDG